MLEIDGSYGEGGGQILRSALGLSGYTGKSFRMFNVRANRSNPGLSHQHLKCLEAVKTLLDAEVKGNSLRSKEVVFKPKKLAKNELSIDIGTAGSVTLLLQSLLPVIFRAENKLHIEVEGGTDVKWSPPFDYFKHITCYFLEKIGIECGVKLLKRGYYPKGGGKIVFEARKVSKNLFSFTNNQKMNRVRGVSFSSNLPSHVAERQRNSAKEVLEKKLDIQADIEIERDSRAIGKGSGIVVWADLGGGRLGASALGEPGKPAEEVGEEAGNKLIDQITKSGCVDKYMIDQLIPFLGILRGSEVLGTELTSHAQTNSWIVSNFLDVSIDINEEDDGTVLISS
ncbi:RNA 3'-phosphate cyclase [archaeon SCG-AAA382B04]|nr:RNA 3'-phosphate cyclase [archaeon SCG-AAA382B04]